MKYLKSHNIQVIILSCLFTLAVVIVAFRRADSADTEADAALPSPSVTVSASPSPTRSPKPTPTPAESPEASPAAGQPEAPALTEEELKTRIIIGNNVCFRKEPDSESANLFNLYYGNSVEFISEEDGWTKVSNGVREGYVSNEFLCTIPDYPRIDAEELCEFAQTFVGTKYKWAGNSPETGFDCSGFVMYVFDHYGITLNRIASDQGLNGRAVKKEDMQPGDIVLFKSGGKIYHSAICIGDGKIVHSLNEKYGVKVSELSATPDAVLEVRRVIY